VYILTAHVPVHSAILQPTKSAFNDSCQGLSNREAFVTLDSTGQYMELSGSFAWDVVAK